MTRFEMPPLPRTRRGLEAYLAMLPIYSREAARSYRMDDRARAEWERDWRRRLMDKIMSSL